MLIRSRSSSMSDDWFGPELLDTPDDSEPSTSSIEQTRLPIILSHPLCLRLLNIIVE